MKRIIITESDRKSILKQHISHGYSTSLNEEETQPQTIDLKKIREIFESKGFKYSSYPGYSFRMDKSNTGPIKDKSGNYVASYETYIPLKQPSSGFGITDGKTKQLWVDKRGGLRPGTDDPNTYNLIFDLNPNNLIMQTVENGKLISKTKITVDDFYKQLQD